MANPEIIAPDGAVLAMLAFAVGAPIVPDEAAETWLQEQSLLAYDETTSLLKVTERGQAWLAMIGATPLPVQVRMWSDPRGGPSPAAPAADAGLASALADIASVLKTLKVAPAPLAQAPRPAPNVAQIRELAAAMPEGALPPGFQANEHFELPAGQIPPGLARDTEVQVFRRDGKTVTNFAAVILWRHMGKPEDVLGWRRTGSTDSMITPPMLAPTG